MQALTKVNVSDDEGGIELKTAYGKWISMLLALVLAFGSAPIVSPTSVHAAAFEQVIDFEAFQTGPMSAEAGWTNTANTTITDQTSRSGAKSMQIDDNDTTKAYGPIYTFTPIQRGKIEWWAKTATVSRLIAQLQSVNSGVTATAEWMGFSSNGKFVYSNGGTQVFSVASYKTDTWYRFTIQFNAVTQKKTIAISDGTGDLLLETDVAFREAGITTLNRFRFSTFGSDVGLFHIDDLRIQELDGLEEQPQFETKSFDFESFATGALNKQFGWVADAKSTITDQTAKSGTKSIQIDDNDDKAYGPYYNFPSISQGKVEWWAKTNAQVRLITQLQSVGAAGTLTAEWMGFNSTGKFVYYDGAKRLDTPVSYQLNTWYRFTLLFDAAAQKKTLIISDDNGIVFVKTDLGFRDSGITTLNRFRFSTISTDIGMFHIDDLRISDQLEDNPRDLTGLSLLESSFAMSVGQSVKLQAVGTYSHGGINLVNRKKR